MKTARPLLVAIVLTLARGTAAAAGSALPSDSPLEREHESYAVGYQIGGDFRGEGNQLDGAALLRGFGDASAGRPSAIPAEDLHRLLVMLKARIESGEPGAAGPGVAAAPVAEPTAAANRKLAPGAVATARRHGHRPAEDTTYLVEFASRPGVVTLPNGLAYQQLQAGTGPSPTETQRVRLRYRGTLVTGEEFGSTRDGEGASRVFKVSSLMPGLRAAVLQMQVGSQWLLAVPPTLGFDSGNPLYRRTTLFEIALEAIEPAAG